MIFQYFKKLKDKINRFSHIISNWTNHEKTYSRKRGFIAGKVYFTDKSRLDFTEVKDVEEKEKIKYSYHYMNPENEISFRYDNAKHHQEVSTFPHHKHTKNKIIESQEPDIEDILTEIEKEVIKRKKS